ncbi:hypothetical protein G7939_17795 [Ralstonia solanacearum]|uniref:hypothetical protein n=1 Tax=Ralstonia pseudosolanacearum TaxID=1310165 RepID=UPI000B622873|nr:hypothetical protein [Ralstonia pseudosolanacearum]QIK25116.1 hypothetical protein G7939_17795 [Ralstonia solanacearum]ASL73409.1 hypothetical protein BC350_07015 [Ralstonia pseudosolanacearum]MCK4118208.1 hypothetical protein [Ralstonia pseudosolanacearum]QIK26848.1 hypothetical protein G7947_00025 [Ralstonia solanacearum]QIK31753.1 hypothetical protein G7969_00025 [Ralstonia solanacearum]
MIDSLFFASYRDVYDALNSAPLRATREFLCKFLRERGYVVSGLSNRAELVDRISSLTLSHQDLDVLMIQIDTTSRKEKTRSFTLDTNVDVSQLKLALEQVKKARSGYNEHLVLVAKKGSPPYVTVDYLDLDYSKTSMRQKKFKDGKIEFFTEKGNLRVRYSASDRLEAVTSDLMEQLRQITKTEPKRDQIELTGLDKASRTLFFKTLINAVKGYQFMDVMKVSVSAELESDSDKSDDDDVDLDSSVAEEKTAIETELKSLFRRAAFEGQQLLVDDSLDNFIGSDFFFYRVVWLSEKKGGNRVEFEALFENPAKGTGFTYGVKSVYRLKKGTKKPVHCKGAARPTAAEEAEHLADLEAASRTALDLTHQTIAQPEPVEVGEGDES